MSQRSNSTPLWKQLEEISNNQLSIIEKSDNLLKIISKVDHNYSLIMSRLDKFALDIENVEKLLGTLSGIAIKTNELTQSIEKIDVNKLEQTLVQLDDKIPNINPLINKLETVIRSIGLISNELGLSLEVKFNV